MGHQRNNVLLVSTKYGLLLDDRDLLFDSNYALVIKYDQCKFRNAENKFQFPAKIVTLVKER